jgi:hypothetical protein
MQNAKGKRNKVGNQVRIECDHDKHRYASHACLVDEVKADAKYPGRMTE